MIWYRDVHTGQRVAEKEALRELRRAVPRREIRIDEVLTARERLQLPHALEPAQPAAAPPPAKAPEQLSFPSVLLERRAAPTAEPPATPAPGGLDGVLAEVAADAAVADDDDGLDADTDTDTDSDADADADSDADADADSDADADADSDADADADGGEDEVSAGAVLPGREDELADLSYEEDLNGEEQDIEPADPTGGA